MKFLSWSKLTEINKKELVEYNGFFSPFKFSNNKKERSISRGYLKNINGDWQLYLSENVKKDPNYKSEKNIDLYGVNKDNLYVKLIDAYKISNNNKFRSQAMGMKSVMFFSDKMDIDARYTDIIISYDILDEYLYQLFNLINYKKDMIQDKKYICRIKFDNENIDVYLWCFKKKVYFDIKFLTYIKDLTVVKKITQKLRRILAIFYNIPLKENYVYLTNEDGNLSRIFLPITIEEINLNSEDIHVDPLFPGVINYDMLENIVKGEFENSKVDGNLENAIIRNYKLITNNVDLGDELKYLTQSIESIYADKTDEIDSKRIDENKKFCNEIKDAKKEIKKLIRKVQDNRLKQELMNKFNKFYSKVNPVITELRNPSEKPKPMKLKNKILLFLKSNFSDNAKQIIESRFGSLDSWAGVIVNTRVHLEHSNNDRKGLEDIKDFVETVNVLKVLERFFIIKEIGVEIPDIDILLESELKSVINIDYKWID